MAAKDRCIRATDPTIAFIGPMRQQSQQSTDVTYCRDERFQQRVDMA
jgi:hypothetical protein